MFNDHKIESGNVYTPEQVLLFAFLPYCTLLLACIIVFGYKLSNYTNARMVHFKESPSLTNVNYENLPDA